MNMITLYRANGNWIARFTGQHSYEVIAACGTADIPTPFTDQVPAGEVAELIQKRNPGATIVTKL